MSQLGKPTESKKPDSRAEAFFKAAASKLGESDSTVLAYCEGDYELAAQFLGVELDGQK